MVKKTVVLIPVFVAAALIGILGLAFMPPGIKNKNIDFPKGTIKINEDTINVEIADSPAHRQRWMMFRQDRLPVDTAMILVYDRPDLYPLWLLNIQYNLDLIWVNENGNVVYLVNDVPPCENALDQAKCTYKNTQPAKYIIASSSGFITQHKINLKSKMAIISI